MNARTLLGTPGLAPVLGALPHARLVGGCVRDMLAKRQVADIDLATPDPPDRVFSKLEQSGLKAIPTGIAHGTITAISAGQAFEITTLRRDEKSFGRHARVSWTDDFREDAARRDFTINAMSLDRDGTVYDYFEGATDLAAGRLRFVGEAKLRVSEDYLRCLRYFRFYARYGQPPPDPAAIAAIEAGKAGLTRLSAERVWSELKRIFAAPDPRGALALMHQTGVLQMVLPEAGTLENLTRLIAAGAPPDPMLRIASLLRESAGRLADRLKLATAERDRLDSLLRGPAPAEPADDATLRRLLAEDPAETLVDRAWLNATHCASLAARIEAMPRPLFPLEGRDALALGAAHGPQIGAALRRVRSWWLAEGCTAKREAALERLKNELKL